MVSLARDVRHRSADHLTKDILRRLDGLVAQYRTKSLPGFTPEERRRYPFVTPLMQPPTTDEQELARRAIENNKDLVRTLKASLDLNRELGDLSIGNYTETSLLDAWGSPIVYMPGQHPRIGMAPNNNSFFFSAGQDRKYLSRPDNLYSYESAGE
jgi:hypothetical protein